jgi:hypothetical protein
MTKKEFFELLDSHHPSIWSRTVCMAPDGRGGHDIVLHHNWPNDRHFCDSIATVGPKAKPKTIGIRMAQYSRWLNEWREG